MFISLSSTCIQISVTGMPFLLLLLVFLITFYSRCNMEWDTACRPTDGPTDFLSPGAQEPVQPPEQYLFSLGS